MPRIPPGTYDVGGLDDEMGFVVHAGYDSGVGSSGNVVLTQSTADRVAGWDIVTLQDGGTVSGSSNVPIRVETVHPD